MREAAFACPDAVAMARAVSHGPDEAMMAHLRGCPACASVMRDHTELRALAAQLPFTMPALDRRQNLRADLVAGTAERRVWHRRLVVASGLGAALAAAAILLLLWPRTSTAPTLPTAAISRATIDAASGARFERIAGPPHEVVRLHEGTIRTTVAPATHGETVRIVTGAGEVEVRGTIFDTTARDDRLVAVKVQRGHVIVRVPPDYEDGDNLEISLEAGNAWEAPAPVPAPPTPTSLEARPAPRPAPHHRARPRPPTAAAPVQDPAEQAFGEGLALLRASNLPAAARAFDRAVRLAPLGTLAEDASYWRAIALADNPAGEAALVAFLDRFPQSARAGEVSVMLGWRLVDRDPRAAASRFQAALTDRAARVRKSARAGLDAVARKTGD